MMFDAEMIAQYIGVVILGAAVVFALPWLKERIGAEKLKNLWKLVCIAVQAAEQLFGSGNGDKKKEYALAYLDDIGVTAKTDEAQLDALIEAAVYELTP